MRESGQRDARREVIGVSIATALVLLGLATAAPATAARDAHGKDERAITAAFLDSRDGDATVTAVRISTADRAYAAVEYRVTPSTPGSARLAGPVAAPVPQLFKRTGSDRWKSAAKVPGKVKKDLKAKADSDIRIAGDVVAFLHARATCGGRGGFYSAGVYDKLGNVYLSLEFPAWHGYGGYEALGVNSVATLAVGTGGTSYQYETGQGSDAFASSGVLYVDRGWGLIDAGMAHVPDAGGPHPISVDVDGFWVCR